MGAAIDVFDGAQAIRVGRERFAPVKTTNDLLALRSDAYELHDDGRIVARGAALAARRSSTSTRALQARARLRRALRSGRAVARGLRASLTVRGDVAFGPASSCAARSRSSTRARASAASRTGRCSRAEPRAAASVGAVVSQPRPNPPRRRSGILLGVSRRLHRRRSSPRSPLALAGCGGDDDGDGAAPPRRRRAAGERRRAAARLAAAPAALRANAADADTLAGEGERGAEARGWRSSTATPSS